MGVGDHVDCLDSVSKWCNAEIVAKKGGRLKVHFTGWSFKYDEWLPEDSHRLLKQWKRGTPIQLNNRLDVRDVKGKWLEAQVILIDEDEGQMLAHFKGFSNKWDELIHLPL